MATRFGGGLQTDPTNKKGLTGGSSKVGKKQDTSPLITGKADSGGPGFANPIAFKTDAQLAKEARISFEKATGNKAGYKTMTDSEREEYRVKNMGIAPTKTDDYSAWGIARKAAADEAHSEGKMSRQDKKDQKTIDARDASRHNYEVTKPKEQAAASLKARSIKEKRENKYKTNKGKYSTSIASSKATTGGAGRGNRTPRSSSKASKGFLDSNRRDTTRGFLRDSERYGSPTEQKGSTLAKNGWTPEQIMEFSGNYTPFEALRVQNALPGVQGLTEAESAAQYGGAGKATAMSMQMIQGTVMSPIYKNAKYGQGLGGEKTKTLLPYESGGQLGAGPSGLGALGPILVDIQLGGKGY